MGCYLLCSRSFFRGRALGEQAKMAGTDESTIGFGCFLLRSSFAEGAVSSCASSASLGSVEALSFKGYEKLLETKSYYHSLLKSRFVDGMRSSESGQVSSLCAFSKAFWIKASRSRLPPSFFFLPVRSCRAACCPCAFFSLAVFWLRGWPRYASSFQRRQPTTSGSAFRHS